MKPTPIRPAPARLPMRPGPPPSTRDPLSPRISASLARSPVGRFDLLPLPPGLGRSAPRWAPPTCSAWARDGPASIRENIRQQTQGGQPWFFPPIIRGPRKALDHVVLNLPGMLASAVRGRFLSGCRWLVRVNRVVGAAH